MKTLTIIVLVALAMGAPAVVAQQDDAPRPDGFLYAHWPEDSPVTGPIEIPMDTKFPMGEPNFSLGPGAPGAKDVAGQYTDITLSFVNVSGEVGPAAPIELDPTQPAHLVLYLAADQVLVPTFVPMDPEQNPDWGVMTVMVEAVLILDGETVGSSVVTQLLVSTPMEVGHELNIPIEFDVPHLEAGAPVQVHVEIFQTEQAEQRAMTPGWNIYTGEQYPVGLQLPILNSEALTTPINVATNVTEDLNVTSVDDGGLGVPHPAIAAPLAMLIVGLARRRWS